MPKCPNVISCNHVTGRNKIRNVALGIYGSWTTFQPLGDTSHCNHKNSTVQCQWKTRLIPSCGSWWVDAAKLIPLDRFSDALIAEDAPPEHARLAWRPCHSLDVEMDPDVAGSVNSNASAIAASALIQHADACFHRGLRTLTCNAARKYKHHNITLLHYLLPNKRLNTQINKLSNHSLYHPSFALTQKF